jgi:hypothetical protein
MFFMISIVFIVYCAMVIMVASCYLSSHSVCAYREIIPQIREKSDCFYARLIGELTLCPISSGLLLATHTLSKNVLRLAPLF